MPSSKVTLAICGSDLLCSTGVMLDGKGESSVMDHGEVVEGGIEKQAQGRRVSRRGSFTNLLREGSSAKTGLLGCER